MRLKAPNRGDAPSCTLLHDEAERQQSTAPSTNALIEMLISEHRDPARLLELHYWSQEPDVLPIIRTLCAMREKPRSIVAAFLSMADDPKTIGAMVNARGEVTMFSQQVETALLDLQPVLRERAPETEYSAITPGRHAL
jgi:hypothetical protein